MFARRRSLVTAALATAALAAPATAAADSIVFVQDGNVFSSRPDGSGKVQLTTGGSWHSPTQAADGRIAAVQGVGPIQVMARDGRPLHTIDTPNAPTGNGGTFAGAPKQLAFTPDGTRIAYSYIQGACPIGSSCDTAQTSTFYTENKPGAATPHTVWGNQFGGYDPTWITNDRALIFGGYGARVNIDPLGGGDYSSVNWINGDADWNDGEVSPDGKRFAVTLKIGDEHTIGLWRVNGDLRTDTPPPAPTAYCGLGPSDPHFAGSTWSPDSNGLAFTTSKGVEVLRFTNWAPDACRFASDSVLIAPGGSQPDWGPADPPARRWNDEPKKEEPKKDEPKQDGQQQQQTPAQPGTTPGNRPAGGGARTVSVRAGGAARQKLAAGGLSVTCTPSAAGRCSAVATVKVGRRTYRATASGTARSGKALTLKLRFGKAAQKAIRKALRRGRLKATVKLTVAGVGAATGTATRTVTLTR